MTNPTTGIRGPSPPGRATIEAHLENSVWYMGWGWGRGRSLGCWMGVVSRKQDPITYMGWGELKSGQPPMASAGRTWPSAGSWFRTTEQASGPDVARPPCKGKTKHRGTTCWPRHQSACECQWFQNAIFKATYECLVEQKLGACFSHFIYLLKGKEMHGGM